MPISLKFLTWLGALALLSACQPSPKTAPSPTGSANLAAQNLIGTWSFAGGGGVDPVVLAFTPQGKLLVLQSLDRQTLATQFDYAIDPQPTPMQLDLKPQKPQVAETEIAKTIFDLTAKGQLVLPPLAAMKPAQPRPQQMVGGVTYQRVSAETTLQPPPQAYAELPKLEPATPEQQASHAGLMYVRLLAIAQQAYYLDNGALANSLQQIGNPNTDTEDYRYQMNFQGSELVFITAQALRPKLPSFVSVVFKLKPKTVGYDVVYATGCQTVKPAQVPPALPIIDFDQGKIKCPGGSQEY
jgi:Type IV pilin-like G and H, putative